ncbi:MAG: hypothetical protein ACI9JN_001824 [Bacteroidia bacterium]|jgi:hypothetical protein
MIFIVDIQTDTMMDMVKEPETTMAITDIQITIITITTLTIMGTITLGITDIEDLMAIIEDSDQTLI